jgi:hypothetical protein
MILRVSDLGPPRDYEEIDPQNVHAGLSNFDHEVPDGLEDHLRSERVFTRYAGWNFNGLVWLDAEGSFSCQVWTYHTPVATVRAATLKDLMVEVSNEWGWD